MKKLFLFLFSILLSTYGLKSQIVVCVGDSATACAGQTVQINNCGGLGANPIGLVLNNPTIITPNLSDDSYSAAVNIGFNFNFFGNNFSQVTFGSNGILSFNMANANGYCPWSLNGQGTLPSTGNLNSCKNGISLAYQDMHPSLAGTTGNIQYQTIGTAPNRKFVGLYREIGAFSCGLSQCNYLGVILYETTNVVEVHIGRKVTCSTWNGGLAIQGIENAAGTVAYVTPGRNNSQWQCINDGRRWTPASPTNTNTYSMSQIPYIQIVGTGSSTLWANTQGQSFPYNGGTLNITSLPTTTTGYFLTSSACGTAIGSISDTTWLSIGAANVSTSFIPDTCGQGIGSVTATPGALSPPPYTYNWPSLGANTATVDSVPAGTYDVTLTDGNGCTATASVTVTSTNATYSATSTQASCLGSNDGTATAQMSPPLGNVTYLWSPGGQTTQTATNLTAGNYTCTISSNNGCSGTASVSVTEIPSMQISLTNVQDASCNSTADGTATVNITQGTAPYTYVWSNSSSTTNAAIDLAAGSHTVTITDSNGCTTDTSFQIAEPPALALTSITNDTMVCPNTTLNLNATGTGGSSPYTYTWTKNGTTIGTGPSFNVTPIDSFATYCVTLSEQCGSPTTQLCVNVTVPTSINPNVTPDITAACIPGTFTFTNNSSNSSEIQSVQYVFSNGDIINTSGSNSFTHTLNTIGLFSLDMIVTSIYGCTYQNTFPDIVIVTDKPEANFTISQNPVTWFETEVQTQDISIGNIAQWEWYSPDATPMLSYDPSALLTFPEGVVGTYPIQLIVTTTEGCSDSITLELEIVPDIIFYAPNSFTPDDDEYNQSWGIIIEGIDLESFSLLIFNRWGEVIWESYDSKAKWNGYYHGEKVPAGTYSWRVNYKDRETDGKTVQTGFINVLR